MPQTGTQRGLTPRAFAVGLVLVLLWLAFDCTLGNYYALATLDLLILIGFGALFTTFVVTFFNNRLAERRRLTPQELTVIYVMVAVAIPWGALLRGALESPIKMLVLFATKREAWLAWMKPPWCVDSEDAIDAFRQGGITIGQIPWHVWTRPILYWSGILLSFQALAWFAVLFFRELFIEEEKLPFPLASVGQTLIDYRPPTATDAASRRFGLGIRVAFVVGLLICMPGILSVTPESYRPIPMAPQFYGTTTGLIQGQSIRLTWDPFVLCFLMFFPVDVLMTVVVCHVTMRIAMPGLLRWLGLARLGGIGDFFSEGWMLQVFGIGGLAGLVFWTLFFNRRKIVRSLRQAVRGGRSRDGNSPLGLRTIVIGLVLSASAFVVLFVYGLGDISDDLARHTLSIVIVLAVIFGMLFAIMRQSAEAGFLYHSPWTLGKIIAFPHRFYMVHPAPLWRTQGSFFAIGHCIHFGAYHNTIAPHLGFFSALKIAHLNHTSTRDVLKAAVITLLLSVPLVVIGYLVLIHHFGFEHGTTPATYADYTFSQPMLRMAYEATPTIFSAVPPWFSVPVGVTLIGVVMYLRREHVRFPFSPVGVVLTAALSTRAYGTPDIWFAMVIALVVKTAIYRWFGVAFFRTRAMPILVYLMMGLMTGMLIFRILFAAMGYGFLRSY